MYTAFKPGKEFPESDVTDSGNSYFAANWFRNFRHWEIPGSEIPALISPIPAIPDFWNQSPECRKLRIIFGFPGR